jgi:hypothetical protein
VKYRRLLLVPFVLLGLAGCEAQSRQDGGAPGSAAPAASAMGTRFDPATAAAVRGQVLWHGDVPTLPTITAPVPDGAGGYRYTEKHNPFLPAVDAKSHGLAGAVVFLKGIDPTTGRAWDLPPVRVEQRDYGILVHQGDGEPRKVGFVRRGDDVEMVSTEPAHHMLRARGAAFFTLPFPEPNKPLSRPLSEPGLVELTSGAGYSWAAADLFVCEHPYYAVTDSNGNFALPQVPPGKYELTVWVRNWHVTRKERDPETGLVFRRRYAPPLEKRTTITVEPNGKVERSFTLGAADFAAPK